MTQTFQNVIALIKSDMYRFTRDDFSTKAFLKLMIQQRGFLMAVIVRLTRYYYLNGPKPIYLFFKIINHFMQIHFTCEIPYSIPIGSGLQIFHLYGLIINHTAVLGRNLNLSHYITFGSKPNGRWAGAPTLMDNIYVAPGAQIIGGVTIGNHAAVGANCVVTKDVPDYGVVVGIPGKVISDAGSTDYIPNTDYEDKIPHLPGRENW